MPEERAPLSPQKRRSQEEGASTPSKSPRRGAPPRTPGAAVQATPQPSRSRKKSVRRTGKRDGVEDAENVEVSAVSRSLFAASPMSKKTAQSTPKKAGKVAASYKIIQRATGSLGGNADGGAIYGELTEGSMQRIVETLKTHCQFGAEHSFIDVGSGLGKPNVHAAQDPGAIMSYGLELEELRWQLGMVNLKALLAAEEEDVESSPVVPLNGES